MNRQIGDPRTGRSRPPGALAVVVCGGALIVGGITLSNLSITGSSDSACESILDSHAVWGTESSCGIAHIGTLAIVIALLAVGVGLIVAARLGSRGHTPLRVAGRLAAAAAVLGVVATAVLAVRVATYDEPVLRRGWSAVRDVSALSTVGLWLVAGLIAACRRSGRHAPTRRVEHRHTIA